MSIEALNWALNLQLDKPVWKAVLIGIANHANPNGRAWPSVARLALYSGYKERIIRKAISDMTAEGWLHKEERTGSTTVYTLCRLYPCTTCTPASDASPPLHDVHPNHNRTINKNNKRKMSSDWMPTVTMIEFAHANGMEARRVQDEADRFRDYWIGTGKPMADWEATWRNWIRRNRGIQGSRSSGFIDRNTRVASQNRSRLDNVASELAQYEATAAGDHRQVGGSGAIGEGTRLLVHGSATNRTSQDS